MSNSHSSPRAEFPSTNSDLWHLYVQTYSGIASYLDKVLRKQANIKLDDFNILTVLTQGGIQSDPPQVVRMGEIAADLSVSPSRLTYQIERLIHLGWVDRIPVKEDRRGKGVFITDAGYKHYMNARAIHTDIMDTVVMAGLNAKEANALASALKHMRQSVQFD